MESSIKNRLSLLQFLTPWGILLLGPILVLLVPKESEIFDSSIASLMGAAATYLKTFSEPSVTEKTNDFVVAFNYVAPWVVLIGAPILVAFISKESTLFNMVVASSMASAATYLKSQSSLF